MCQAGEKYDRILCIREQFILCVCVLGSICMLMQSKGPLFSINNKRIQISSNQAMQRGRGEVTSRVNKNNMWPRVINITYDKYDPQLTATHQIWSLALLPLIYRPSAWFSSVWSERRDFHERWMVRSGKWFSVWSVNWPLQEVWVYCIFDFTQNKA